MGGLGDAATNVLPRVHGVAGSIAMAKGGIQMRCIQVLGRALLLASVCFLALASPAAGSDPTKGGGPSVVGTDPGVTPKFTETMSLTAVDGSMPSRGADTAATAGGVSPQIFGAAYFWFQCGSGATCVSTFQTTTGFFQTLVYASYNGGSPFLFHSRVDLCSGSACGGQYGIKPTAGYAIAAVIMHGTGLPAASVQAVACWCGNGVPNCSVL